MKKLLSILLLIYIQLGAIVFPFGDFSAMPELPKMYSHCMLEDKDMNFFDFVTDHLVNIDGFFDQHNHQDEQQPHHPLPFQKIQHTSAFNTTEICCLIPAIPCFSIVKPVGLLTVQSYKEEFFGSIFRPPIS